MKRKRYTEEQIAFALRHPAADRFRSEAEAEWGPRGALLEFARPAN